MYIPYINPNINVHQLPLECALVLLLFFMLIRLSIRVANWQTADSERQDGMTLSYYATAEREVSGITLLTEAIVAFTLTSAGTWILATVSG